MIKSKLANHNLSRNRRYSKTMGRDATWPTRYHCASDLAVETFDFMKLKHVLKYTMFTLPVLTRSPLFRSTILILSPFSRESLAPEGKHTTPGLHSQQCGLPCSSTGPGQYSLQLAQVNGFYTHRRSWHPVVREQGSGPFQVYIRGHTAYLPIV